MIINVVYNYEYNLPAINPIYKNGSFFCIFLRFRTNSENLAKFIGGASSGEESVRLAWAIRRKIWTTRHLVSKKIQMRLSKLAQF